MKIETFKKKPNKIHIQYEPIGFISPLVLVFGLLE